jgi:arsenate reductase
MKNFWIGLFIFTIPAALFQSQLELLMPAESGYVLCNSALAARAQLQEQKTVLFVCEHGSAKSIVAASHFKRLATAQGLNVKVFSRGTKPDKAIPQKITQYLAEDKLPEYPNTPEQLMPIDVTSADYVVTFVQLPDSLNRSNVEIWNVPSFESGYPAARDSIVNKIQRMIVKIKSDNKN